jgi:hypothetical protein
VKRRDACLRQKPFGRVDLTDALRRGHRLCGVAATEARSDQIELEKVAQRLNIPRVEGDCRVDLAAKSVRQKQQMDRPRMLCLDAQNLGELTVVFGDAAIQRHGLFGESERRVVIAERVANLREEKVPERVVGRLVETLFHQHSGPLPVAGRDQFLRLRLLAPGFRGHPYYENRDSEGAGPKGWFPLVCNRRHWLCYQLRGSGVSS